MKKILMILIVALLLFFTVKVDASEEKYENLVDMTQISYNSTDNVFFTEQKIPLSKDVQYTLVATSKFFGDATKTNWEALDRMTFGTYKTSDGTTLTNISMTLYSSSLDLYYGQVTPSEDCYMEITDFLATGYTLDTLPKNEFILFKGGLDAFQGFMAVDKLEGYENVNETIEIYTDYSNPITVEKITEKIKIYDNTQGFYNDVTLVSDDYHATSELGVYSLQYSAKDHASNTSVLNVKVNVVDATPPVITGLDVIEWSCYEQAPTETYFKNRYTAVDEVDGNLSVRIVESTLMTFLMGVKKEYTVKLAATDKSGNTAYKTVILNSHDINAPILVTADMTVKLSELGNQPFLGFAMTVLINISDDSGDYNLDYVSREISGRAGFTGEFEVTLTASDAEGNKITRTAKVTVVDDIPPEFYMAIDLLETSTNNVYSLDDIKKEIGKKLKQDGILYEEINLISCDYVTNEDKAGTYKVKYSYRYKDSVNYMEGTINVLEYEEPTYEWALLLLIIPVILVAFIVNKRRQNSY